MDTKLTRRNFLMGSAAMAGLGLAACAQQQQAPAPAEASASAEPSAAEPSAAEPSAAEPSAPAREEDAGTMVVGYSPFSSKFSPFFAETAYDQDVANMTQLALFPLDRLGQVIYKGIEGETYEYNGTPYTYNGPADIEVTENEDGTVFYDIKIREDLKFSDGEPVTIDDVIFSMYVRCDPTYDGSATLFSQPVEGMEAYRSGMMTRLDAILAAGKENTDYTNWTEDQQKAVWDFVETAPKTIAEEIVAYCVGAGLNEEGDIAGAAGTWGFTIPEGGTIDDFAQALIDGYTKDGVFDVVSMVGTENAGSSVETLLPNYPDYQIGVSTGESAPNITGIQKTGDYSMRVVSEKVDATLIYQLGVELTPLHYYGDKAQYNYDANQFGFPKGDLSSVRAKISEPMGAGMYKFLKFENGVVNFEANENYYKGAPKTKFVNFREVQDVDKLNGVVQGSIDVTDPSWSKDTANAVSGYNGGETTGNVITTDTVDNLGYGYIGINTHNVAVGGDPASAASKNLRKGLATVLAAYRDVAIDSYYGEAAEVINYPISNTSWAAPQATDDGYRVAFSTDVNGADIYTSGMSADDRYAAAKTAALGFFEAAGYTVADGKITAAPEGAKMEYEVMIPADGTGDHPAFMILTEAKTALEEIGMKLVVNDLSNSSDLWTKLEAQQGEMWCAAWNATVDPDMYQIYYSDVANGGAQAGGSNYMYQIEDAELDQLILDARASTDQAYRKQIYKACLDIIIDWACEIPTYQRQNAIIFSTERVNMDTVTPDITTFYDWKSELEKTEMK